MIKNVIVIPCKVGEVSDGYHTFDELYEHRCTLFLALMKTAQSKAWFSLRHDDNSEFEGWFICGIDLEPGTVSYHLPNSMLELARLTGATELPNAPKWDGHTSADVVKRIQQQIKL